MSAFFSLDLAEQIAVEIRRDIGEGFEELVGDSLGLGVAGEAEKIILRQHSRQFRLVVLDGFHRLLEGLGDVLARWKAQQIVVAGVIGEIEPALFDGDVRDGLFPAGALEFPEFRQNRGFVAAIVVIGEFEEDQPQHGDGILARLQVGIGAEVVGGPPEVVFELFELVAGHGA